MEHPGDIALYSSEEYYLVISCCPIRGFLSATVLIYLESNAYKCIFCTFNLIHRRDVKCR